VLGLVGAARVLANVCYGVAVRGELLSLVAVLASLYPVFTLMLARQSVMAFIVLGGVLLIASG
jgi:hypothetical protein